MPRRYGRRGGASSSLKTDWVRRDEDSRLVLEEDEAVAGRCASDASTRCRLSGKTLFSRGGVVVKRVSPADGPRTYGCSTRSGKARRLESKLNESDYTSANGPFVATRRRYLAFLETEYFDPGFVTSLSVFDLVRGKRHHVAVTRQAEIHRLVFGGSPGRFRAAWIAESDGTFYVDRAPSRPDPSAKAFDTLDQGPIIVPDSLRILSDGVTLRWVNGGEERTAPL
jgi:hypothetical protein